MNHIIKNCKGLNSVVKQRFHAQTEKTHLPNINITYIKCRKNLEVPYIERVEFESYLYSTNLRILSFGSLHSFKLAKWLNHTYNKTQEGQYIRCEEVDKYYNMVYSTDKLMTEGIDKNIISKIQNKWYKEYMTYTRILKIKNKNLRDLEVLKFMATVDPSSSLFRYKPTMKDVKNKYIFHGTVTIGSVINLNRDLELVSDFGLM